MAFSLLSVVWRNDWILILTTRKKSFNHPARIISVSVCLFSLFLVYSLLFPAGYRPRSSIFRNRQGRYLRREPVSVPYGGEVRLQRACLDVLWSSQSSKGRCPGRARHVPGVFRAFLQQSRDYLQPERRKNVFSLIYIFMPILNNELYNLLGFMFFAVVGKIVYFPRSQLKIYT